MGKIPGLSWKEAVENLQAGDEDAAAALYRYCRLGVKFHIAGRCGWEEADDITHNVFLIVLTAVKCNAVREPERLGTYIETVSERQIYAQFQRLSRRRLEIGHDACVPVSDRRPGPECMMLERERLEELRRALGGLKPGHREVLERFYLKSETKEQVCEAMGLSDTQFRLIKSRAKQRVTEIAAKPRRRCLTMPARTSQPALTPVLENGK